MKIGIGLPNTIPGTPGSVLVEWARRAEARGFTTLATIDRVAYPSYESLVALAAAGAVTERVELFTNILLAPTRNTVLLAKEAASVDQISGGRLTLGLAVGNRPDDYEAAGQPFENRGHRFDEQLQTLQEAWSGKPVSGSDKPIGPRPVRDEGIPIMIGGNFPGCFDRIVKWGVGWTAGGGPAEQAGPFAQQVREAWKAAGKEGQPRIVALSYFGMGPDVETSKRTILDYYAYLGGFEKDFAEYLPRGAEAVRETVEKFEEAGIDELMFDPTIPDPAEVDLLADTVL
ncbi:MAG: LLM class flavin-dependent oxidoreductase [Actinomycetota bacterium]|nr:LLM class flavin-dependent oxidoreductase [Actinomycetota bacterium]